MVVFAVVSEAPKDKTRVSVKALINGAVADTKLLPSETVLGRQNLAGVLALGMIVVIAVVMAAYAGVQRVAARWQS